jgi:hypothetical protein
MDAAYEQLDDDQFRASALTGGPWQAEHQHAGPPSALICRAVERAGGAHGLTHIGRLTVNLLRPLPIGDCRIEVGAAYVGRAAGHFAGKLVADGKDIALFTALAQREQELSVPEGTPGHPLPLAPKNVQDSKPSTMAINSEMFGYAQLVENRLAEGVAFKGPSSVWFRLNHPLVKGEEPSPYQRVAVAADSGNGISAALDFRAYVFVNCDLTINLFRRPVGDWICLQAQSLFGGNGCGLAESALYDQRGLIGQATQSLAVRRR